MSPMLLSMGAAASQALQLATPAAAPADTRETPTGDVSSLCAAHHSSRGLQPQSYQLLLTRAGHASLQGFVEIYDEILAYKFLYPTSSKSGEPLQVGADALVGGLTLFFLYPS